MLKFGHNSWLARLIPLTMTGLQFLLSLRVLGRLLTGIGGEKIVASTVKRSVVFSKNANPGLVISNAVSIIIPVLNEYERLTPCLESVIQQGSEVAEILVVDGGSQDGTEGIIRSFMERDERVRLIDASPVPLNWNGKAWGLHVGLAHIQDQSNWVLTIDADVVLHPVLTSSLLAQALQHSLHALSVATAQRIEGVGLGLLHPSLLTTLVYRFGMPGKATRQVSKVQANGQCFLFHRSALEACGGFAVTSDSLCEDVTIARALVQKGYVVGFFETEGLITVTMYRDWLECWQNWTRSLPMHDRFSGLNTLLGWLDILLVQALPLPLFLLLWCIRSPCRGLLWLNGFLAMVRIGVLFGTARAYVQPPRSYWLSPLCDIPVTLKLGQCILRRRYTWRGRTLVRGGNL